MPRITRPLHPPPPPTHTHTPPPPNAQRRAALLRKTRLKDLIRPRLPASARRPLLASLVAEVRFQRGKVWAYTVLGAFATPATRRATAKEAARRVNRAWGEMNHLPTVDTARSDPFRATTAAGGGGGRPAKRPNPLKRVPEAITRMVPDYGDPSGLRRAARRAAAALQRARGGSGGGNGGTAAIEAINAGVRPGVGAWAAEGGAEPVASEFRRLSCAYAPVAYGTPARGGGSSSSVAPQAAANGRTGYGAGYAYAEEEDEEDSESEASDWAMEREADWEEEEDVGLGDRGWDYGAEPCLAANDPDASARPARRFRAVLEVTSDPRVALQVRLWPAWTCPRLPCRTSHPGTPTRPLRGLAAHAAAAPVRRGRLRPRRPGYGRIGTGRPGRSVRDVWRPAGATALGVG